MRGVVFSAVRYSFGARALALSFGCCTFVSGCGDQSTANKADTQAAPPAAEAAPAGMFPTGATPTLTAVPENRYAAGDRYAATPRVDPAVQPASYGATPQSPSGAGQVSSAQGPSAPVSPSEQEFVPSAEELQLFEQPNFDKSAKAPPRGWFGGGPSPSFTIGGVRENPLPHSP